MKKAIKYTIIGRVQGVGFRFFTMHIANQIGLKGYVKNLPNGNVEVLAIGSSDQHELLEQKLYEGPSFSKVNHIEKEDTQSSNGFLNFKIV